jgi:hypothetical protein
MVTLSRAYATLLHLDTLHARHHRASPHHHRTLLLAQRRYYRLLLADLRHHYTGTALRAEWTQRLHERAKQNRHQLPLDIRWQAMCADQAVTTWQWRARAALAHEEYLEQHPPPTYHNGSTIHRKYRKRIVHPDTGRYVYVTPDSPLWPGD